VEKCYETVQIVSRMRSSDWALRRNRQCPDEDSPYQRRTGGATLIELKTAAILNDSVVIRIKYMQTKIIVTGDAEWDTENELIRT
jgi:hypothetical protein